VAAPDLGISWPEAQLSRTDTETDEKERISLKKTSVGKEKSSFSQMEVKPVAGPESMELMALGEAMIQQQPEEG